MNPLITVGIFFGGPSREREISFAGGRTVYDNLDKSLFRAIPIFVDSNRNLIQLDWPFIYKGTIRDFYPPVEFLPDSEEGFQIYLESLGELSLREQEEIIVKVGRKVTLDELPRLIDFAFLALHGEFGEDGQIQGLMESLHIPYSGSGIRACSIGMDKAFQKKLMEAGGFPTPKVLALNRQEWLKRDQLRPDWYGEITREIGKPVVIRPANQGSSIGVTILKNPNPEELEQQINAAFFIKHLSKSAWQGLDIAAKRQFLREMADVRSGLGFPVRVVHKTEWIFHPKELHSFLDDWFNLYEEITLESRFGEATVILEEFLKGREFSCVVIQNLDGQPVALPPTEILKGGEVFDYRSKYLAGLSRKETPIRLPEPAIEAIREACTKLFGYLDFNVYARIDGFYTEDGTIFLNDPNTTSGMLPSSFFFHQAAEIGMNPSQFLTYIIYMSIQERNRLQMETASFAKLAKQLDEVMHSLHRLQQPRKKIGVVLGGYSSERHISVESGRNIYEKLASSGSYEPIPLFLSGGPGAHELHHIPVNLLLKDNADDIRDKITHFSRHQVIDRLIEECAALTEKFVGEEAVLEPRPVLLEELPDLVDGVFIALHGRPGEDGELQGRLEAMNLPYNGSISASAAVTINKFHTLQKLKSEGFLVTDQVLVDKSIFLEKPQIILDQVEHELSYPLIAKPVDDGCSSAVKLVRSREHLRQYLEALFRNQEEMDPDLEEALGLKRKEEFPLKEVALLEKLITQEDGVHFLEITGGLLTHKEGSDLRYEIFEPSEALSSGEVLSLEEKFLAGEGQNITPARFTHPKVKARHSEISDQVRATLLRAAQVLEVTGYARIDAFVRIFADGSAETIIVEINSLPGMTPATCIFHQAAINGYKPFEFIDKILGFAFARAGDSITQTKQ